MDRDDLFKLQRDLQLLGSQLSETKARISTEIAHLERRLEKLETRSKGQQSREADAGATRHDI